MEVDRLLIPWTILVSGSFEDRQTMEQVCSEPERSRPAGVAAVAETPAYLCVAAASEYLSLWWRLASPVLGLRCSFFGHTSRFGSGRHLNGVLGSFNPSRVIS